MFLWLLYLINHGIHSLLKITVFIAMVVQILVNLFLSNGIVTLHFESEVTIDWWFPLETEQLIECCGRM